MVTAAETYLWAEIRGRLTAWYAQGGSWETSWVRSHVDEDTSSREAETYIVAEHLNIQADLIATSFLTGPGARATVEGSFSPLTPVAGALSSMAGAGEWFSLTQLPDRLQLDQDTAD